MAGGLPGFGGTTSSGGGSKGLPGFSGSSKKKKKKGKSLGGFLTNVAVGVEKTVVGAPAAVKTVVLDPVYEDIRHGPTSPQARKAHKAVVETAKGVVKSYADTYGPLLHGDFDTFANNVYENPVGIALDAATVASLGLSAGVKVAIIPAKGGRVLELTDAAGNVTRTKTLARGELRAQLQSLGAKARNAEIRNPVSGKVVRQAGQVVAGHKANVIRRGVRNQGAPAYRFNQALDKLNPSERLATALRMQYDRPALNAEIARLREVAKTDPTGPAAQSLKALTNRRVQKLFDKPNDNMADVIATGREVGARQAQLLNIDDAVAEARRYMPARLAHGGKMVHDPTVKPKTGDRVRLGDGKTGKVAHVYDDGSGVEVRLAGEGGRTVSKGFNEVENLDAPKVIVGGPSIDELKARGLDPAYLPDLAELPDRPSMSFESQGGGRGIPNRVGATRQNQAILRDLGQVIHDPATLGVSFGKALKFTHYNQIHDELLGMAVESEHIPKRHVAIRRKASEHISHTAKTRDQFEEWAKTHLDDKGELKTDVSFTAEGEEAVRGPNGGYMVVPEQVAKKLTGEFHKTGTFTRLMNKGPMRVWRALTLGLTPRWLTNNVVGNSLLYAIRNGSPQDIAGLAAAFRQMLHPKDFAEFDRLLEKHFAGQVQGGFQATQFPSLRPKGRVGRAGSAVAGFLPKYDRRFEQALRSRMVQNELRKHPGLRAHVDRMAQETAEFEQLNLPRSKTELTDQALTENPEITNEIYDRVNDALGSYDHLSAVEKNVVRNLFPFWAWYRAITGVTVKLALDHPLAINLVSHLADIAIKQELAAAGLDPSDVPVSLMGLIPTGIDPDGRVRGINTTGANPFATVGQLADFAQAVANLHAGEIGQKAPGLNPFLGYLISLYSGVTPQGYKTDGFAPVEGLPQSRLLSAIEAQYGIDFPGIRPAATKDPMYDHNVLDELLRYSGVPYVRVSKTAAKRTAEGSR